MTYILTVDGNLHMVQCMYRTKGQILSDGAAKG